MNSQTFRKAKPQWLFVVLGVYDLLLAAGGFYSGIRMLRGVDGLFSTFPPEWIGKLPFESWAPIGYIAMFFALGNTVAALFCLTSLHRQGSVLSLVLGILLAAGMATQIIVFKDIYLATMEFLFVAFFQMLFSMVLLSRRRFVATATEHVR